MSNRGKAVLSAVVMPILFGAISLMYVMRTPRFANLHTVDVLQLLIAGACFGVALSGVFMLISNRRVD